MPEENQRIVEELEGLAFEMLNETWSRIDAAVFIARDAETGILTFVYMGSEQAGKEAFIQACIDRNFVPSTKFLRSEDDE